MFIFGTILRTKLLDNLNKRIEFEEKLQQKQKEMAAKTKRAQNKLVRDFIYKRSLETTKKKTFVNRINYEKLLPLKKRLFPIEFCKSKPRFKPTPYEKPVTRSQGQRSIGSNYANKENQSTSPSNQPKVIFTFNKSFD